MKILDRHDHSALHCSEIHRLRKNLYLKNQLFTIIGKKYILKTFIKRGVGFFYSCHTEDCELKFVSACICISYRHICVVVVINTVLGSSVKSPVISGRVHFYLQSSAVEGNGDLKSPHSSI